MRHINILYTHFISTLPFGFYPANVLELYGRIRATSFGVILYCAWILQYNKLCSLYVSASLYHLVLVIGRTTLIRGYTVLIGDPIAVQY